MGCMDSNAQTAALWGTPWDVLSRHSDNPMQVQSLTETILLTLPERDRRDFRVGNRFRAAMRARE